MKTTGLGRFDDIPRLPLSHTPTPLEKMPNLSAHLGGPGLYIKRDDCTGLGMGGNKSRQLEFYVGEARAQNADTIVITGAVQSNFVRTAAAAARKAGMECHIQLERRVANESTLYNTSGNVLLDRMFGATLHSFSEGEDEKGADHRLEAIATGLRSQGRKPYVIHLEPGHPPLGALGYVVAAAEILTQIKQANLSIDEIVVASGSGATHSGLLFGLRALGSPIALKGICVRRGKDLQRPRIVSRCREIADLLGIDNPVTLGDIELDDDFLAPGYGKINAAVLEAIRLAAHSEGLILDPVYTGKSMAGFLEAARRSPAKRNLLFIHTGGQPAIFSYADQLEPVLSDNIKS